jgi:biopolymer transport protein ExbD
MRLKFQNKSFGAEPFDLTPVIDVVFLLIIFFMLVCQFIAAEQFAVVVPDQIQTAQSQTQQTAPLTVTVLIDEQQQAVCAVGSQRLANVEGQDLAKLISSDVDEAVASSPDKTVRLRCDKRASFGQVKYILSGLSNSTADKLDWAVISR